VGDQVLMPVAGSPSANTYPHGDGGVPSSGNNARKTSEGVLTDSAGNYTIDGLVNLAEAVSFVSSPNSPSVRTVGAGTLDTLTGIFTLGHGTHLSEDSNAQAYLWNPDIAAAIAMAESSGNTQAVDHDSNGSTDYGLWQINSVHGYDPARLLNDPNYNAKAALAVYQSSGWGAWTTYTSGAYLKYLAGAKASVSGQTAAGQQSLDKQSTNTPTGLGSWLSDLGITISWKEIGVLFLGGVALILGMYLLVRGK
jgi:hypothetical protein